MLGYVVPRAPNLRAIVLEVQRPAHSHLSRKLDASWVSMTSNRRMRGRSPAR